MLSLFKIIIIRVEVVTNIEMEHIKMIFVTIEIML